MQTTTYRTGEKAPWTGIYAYVRHIDGIGCEPTWDEKEIPLSAGETFPPHRSCSKGVIWQYARQR